MTDDLLRSLLARVADEPREIDADFDRELWDRLESVLDHPAEDAHGLAQTERLIAGVTAEQQHRVQRPRSRRLLGLAAALTLAAVVVAVLVNRADDLRPVEVVPADTPTTDQTTSPSVVPAPAGGLRATVATPLPIESPFFSAIGDGAVWITSTETDSVVRIDPDTNEVVDTIAVGDAPAGVELGAGDVWVANQGSNSVSRIDPTTSTVSKTIPVGQDPLWVEYAGDAIWVSNSLSGTVSKIDVDTGDVVDTVVVGPDPRVHAAEAGSLWVGVRDGTQHRLVRIDLETDEVTRTDVIGGGVGAAGAGAVWMGAANNHIARVDPASNTVVATIELDKAHFGFEFGAGSLWVNTVSGDCATACEATVDRIDPATNTVVDAIDLPAGFFPLSIAVSDDMIWVTDSVVTQSAVRIGLIAAPDTPLSSSAATTNQSPDSQYPSG